MKEFGNSWYFQFLKESGVALEFSSIPFFVNSWCGDNLNQMVRLLYIIFLILLFPAPDKWREQQLLDFLSNIIWVIPKFSADSILVSSLIFFGLFFFFFFSLILSLFRFVSKSKIRCEYFPENCLLITSQ